MCDEIQKLLDEGMRIKEKQIREEEREKVQRETACGFSESGMTIEEIARGMKVNIEDVKRWLKVK